MRQGKKILRPIIYFCVILILLCTFVTLIPDLHKCTSTDCAVCSTIESLGTLLAGLSILTLAKFVIDLEKRAKKKEKIFLLGCVKTPIILRVKLSH